MALTSSAAFSPDALATDVGSVVASKDITSGAIGAKGVASVDGTTMETVGITFVEEVATSTCFNWIKASNSFSISFC